MLSATSREREQRPDVVCNVPEPTCGWVDSRLIGSGVEVWVARSIGVVTVWRVVRGGIVRGLVTPNGLIGSRATDLNTGAPMSDVYKMWQSRKRLMCHIIFA